MPNYSRNDILLVQYPFSDLSAAKVRPAVVVSVLHPSQDNFIVPLTSRLHNLVVVKSKVTVLNANFANEAKPAKIP